MRILTAVDRMYETLTAAEAPRRQLKGVEEWRAEIVVAVQASVVCAAPPGLRIEDKPYLTGRGWRRRSHTRFLTGTPTHSAWLDLCGAIVVCLGKQAAAADELYEGAVNAAKLALRRQQPHQYAKAIATARAAASWRDAATLARVTGQTLMHTEDRIMRPVGDAIASVGTAEVAKDKRYHDRQGG